MIEAGGANEVCQRYAVIISRFSDLLRQKALAIKAAG
jgi:hypothetical protein